MGQTYCARPDTIGEWPGLRPSRTAPASSGEAGGLRWAAVGAAVIRRPSKPDRLAGTTSGRLPLAALMARATFFDDLGNKVPGGPHRGAVDPGIPDHRHLPRPWLSSSTAFRQRIADSPRLTRASRSNGRSTRIPLTSGLVRGWSDVGSALDPADVAGPLLLAQGKLLHLAGRGLGQGLDEVHCRRGLVPRDPGSDVLDQLGPVEFGPRPQHHEGLRPLAPGLVRYADHGDLQDGGVRVDGLLHLDRGDVLAAGDDDVLGPVAQLDVAVRVPHSEVTGVEPAAAEGARGGFGVGVVPRHDVVAAHDDLAHGDAVTRYVAHLVVDHPHQVGLDHGDALQARQGVAMIQAELVRVVDDEMRDGPRDGITMGEIIMRGNNVMTGYYADPEATASAFRDGWFHSGDLGVRHSDGYIQLRDRAKDIIISGGENISTVEVEQAIDSHPAVLEVAVIGIPDETWGERPKAFVVLRPGAELDGAELIEHVRARIARYKAPAAVDFVEALPKTSTGKMQKFALREKEWAGHVSRIQGLSLIQI